MVLSVDVWMYGWMDVDRSRVADMRERKQTNKQTSKQASTDQGRRVQVGNSGVLGDVIESMFDGLNGRLVDFGDTIERKSHHVKPGTTYS